MNDRYLYRAKRTDNGEWASGSYVNTFTEDKECPCAGIYKENHWIVEENGNMVSVDPSTICQCTGRENEWEHDIFQCDEERYEIQFCEDSLTWEAVSVFSSESIELGEFSPSEYVRLGNSIDNPELLEVGE